MICIGIDTDMSKMAVAAVSFPWGVRNPEITPWGAWVVKTPPSKATGADAVLNMNQSFMEFMGSFSDEQPMHVDNEGVAWNPLFVVEHQSIRYTARMGIDPQGILNLGTVAGLVIGQIKTFYPNGQILLPKPSYWKGSKPKDVDQPRTYERLGWKYTFRAKGKGRYAVPDPLPEGLMGIETRTMSDWKHLGDAFGLAIHGVKQCPTQR